VGKPWEHLLVKVVGLDWKALFEATPPTPKTIETFIARALDHLKIGFTGLDTSTPVPRVLWDHKKILETLALQASRQDVIEVLAVSKGWDRSKLLLLNHWDTGTAFDIFTDNQSVANWASGSAGSGSRRDVATLLWKLQLAILVRSPRHCSCHPVAWVPRTLAGAPDLLCNASMDLKRSLHWTATNAHLIAKKSHLRFICDGACRSNTSVAAFATVVLGNLNGSSRILGFWSTFLEGYQHAWRMEASAVEWALGLAETSAIHADSSLPSPEWLVNLIKLACSPWISLQDNFENLRGT